MNNHLKTSQFGAPQKQFLRVGLGNLDLIQQESNVIKDGDIYNTPIRAYISKNQKCEFVEKNEFRVRIKSTLSVPTRHFNPDNSVKHTDFDFETTINYDTHEKGRVFSISTKHINPTPDPRGNFDFMEVVFDSDAKEKIYGLGLQYTESNLKGKKVHVITAEGGVGRGLEPITTMLNQERNHQGGTPTQSYAPTYSFATSERRGFVFPHDELGEVDFSQSETSFSVLMWHTYQMNMNVIHGKTLKDVTTGITSLVGRMKALPAWTQKGAIVGLQGTQEEVIGQYQKLKDSKVPMVAVWMQNWAGQYQFQEGVRLLWNW